MSSPGGHAENSRNPSRSTLRSIVASRTNVLLLLAIVFGTGGLLVSRFGSDSDSSSNVTHEGMLLSVTEPGSTDLHAVALPPEKTPSGSHKVANKAGRSAAVSPTADDTGTPVSDADAADARLRKLVLGSWQQSYYGTRLLTVLPDGKAKMVIRPDGVWTFAFGQQINLDMFWKIENGRIDYGYSGGTPKDKVELASKTWGDRWDEKILDLTDTRLVLLCSDGQTRSEWNRASTEDSSPTVSKDRSPDATK